MVIVSILFIIAVVFSIGACICTYKIFANSKELKSALDTKTFEYQKLKMQYDVLSSEFDVIKKENKQLKLELEAERKVIASHNCKSVDELPKTEKVAKLIGRKPKATK